MGYKPKARIAALIFILMKKATLFGEWLAVFC
jgi:hypothetical protein